MHLGARLASLFALAIPLSLAAAACSVATPTEKDRSAPPSNQAGMPVAPAPSASPSPTTTSSSSPTVPPSNVSRPRGWGAAACPSASDKGFAVGQTLGELGVRDCETGAPASVDEACGAKATWIFAAHTHCPTCRSTAGFTDDVAQAVAGKDVAVVHLVYDDNGTSCAEWKEAYKLAGISNVFVYDDPKGVAFAKLKTSNYTAPSAFLDGNRRITFKEHGLSKAQVLSRIDEALSK
jgi:hypothetical protein